MYMKLLPQHRICMLYHNYLVIKGFAVDKFFNTTLTLIIIAETNYNDPRSVIPACMLEYMLYK